MKKRILFLFLLAIVLQALIFQSAWSQNYSGQEFEKRRLALMDSVKEGLIILFASPGNSGGAHFRQDNDFFYFTGSEDVNAILVMIPATRDSFLFVPQKTEREKMMEGGNSLDDPQAKDRLRLKAIYPISYFEEFLARTLARQQPVLYLRLSPEDSVSEARSETALFAARQRRNPFNFQPSLNQFRAERFRLFYPAAQIKDITPYIDALRMIKSQEEIAILRLNGKISAEAIKKAMLSTRPGAFEYELEAAAVEVLLKNGCRGPAYPPIIGSGPNTCIQHYEKNNRRMQPGELVLMDFGGDLNYLTMDITRTWPVSGKFTEEQKRVYRTVLEVQKACLEAFKPGVKAQDVQEYVAKRLKEKGIDPLGLRGGLGHLVGMSVHDVQSGELVLQEGMVMAIEPALYFPEKNLGIRIEDTVLITKDGCEVLSADVPKEIEEIEALLTKKVLRKPQ
ncbi:MAG: aminopeptidase P N-terminal domain-containing protein [Candidatus Saccharicenans sp.]